MVHRIFKGMVPRTNCKNIELDLLKRYTTLFTIRHLMDSGIDNKSSSNSQGFIDILQNNKRLFNNWFITDKSQLNCAEIDDIKGLIF